MHMKMVMESRRSVVLLLVQFRMVELQLDLSLHRLYMMPQEAMHTYAAFKGSSYNAPRVAAYNAAGGSSYDGPRGTALVMRPLWLLDMMVVMGNAAAPYGLTNAPSYGAAAAAAASPLYGFLAHTSKQGENANHRHVVALFKKAQVKRGFPACIPAMDVAKGTLLGLLNLVVTFEQDEQQHVSSK
ncbi:hypothetical protein OPV22_008681 [Ensete ventricosum]|uniref:Uncharacterized protein n=1 Tax=Ensete ventricosum TaxID=4639 RepID=A0AAV8PQC1_ENSVE|nr:hypothetical protein OPV22_008681 [Ensete ventricosum]